MTDRRSAPRLLYLANGDRRHSLVRLDQAFAEWGLEVDHFWAYGGEFPENLARYDAVFLSGSPHSAYDDLAFVHLEHEVIREAAGRGLPMMGVCFGSQILASALCGRDQVYRRNGCEIGYKELRLLPAAARDDVIRGVGNKIRMFVWHNDEVRADHPDMVVLASSDICLNQIWRFRDQPIWGIQGHPELTAEQAPHWFEQNRARMEKDGACIVDLKASVDPSAEARKLLQNYAALVCRATGRSVRLHAAGENPFRGSL